MHFCQYCSNCTYDIISYVFCLPDTKEIYRYASIDKLSEHYDTSTDSSDEETVFSAPKSRSKLGSISPDDFCMVDKDDIV